MNCPIELPLNFTLSIPEHKPKKRKKNVANRWTNDEIKTLHRALEEYPKQFERISNIYFSGSHSARSVESKSYRLKNPHLLQDFAHNDLQTENQEALQEQLLPDENDDTYGPLPPLPFEKLPSVTPEENQLCWTKEQQTILKQAVENHGRHWTYIKKRYFPEKTVAMCKNRFEQMQKKPTSEKATRSLKKWSDEETEKLKQAIKLNSGARISWLLVSKSVGTRNTTECYNKYKYLLSRNSL